MEQPPKPESPVAVAGLRKSFGEQTVLAGITFQLESGKVTCVLGRSGTGKSVLLKLLIGLESPDAGSIRLVGQDLSSASPEQLNEARKKVGFLFQQAALYDSMTIGENVAFPLRRHTTLSSDDRLARVHQLLASVGMDRDLDKMPSDLSGGMRKRVGLARALALDPVLVMFDEPTAGLDPITKRHIVELMIKLRDLEGVTSVFVTHDLQAASTIATSYAVADGNGQIRFLQSGEDLCLCNIRFIMLQEGAICFQGRYDELIASSDPYVRTFMT